MELDTLSSVLMRLRPKTSFQTAFDAGGKWTIAVPPHKGIKIHTVLKGHCWLSVADDQVPQELREGDCYLLPRGCAFVLFSHLPGPDTLPAEQVVERIVDGVTTYNGGGDCIVSGLYFDFEGSLSEVIFGSLPAVIIVPATTSQSAELTTNIQRFAAEFHGSEIGRSLIMYQLAPIVLLDIIRTYVTDNPENTSWFGALTDQCLSQALNLMHHNYAQRWTLDQLATAAGVSRSKLADRFKSQVGISPMEYLSRWRMEIARELLENGESSISKVAQLVGYESESAFSTAFKRVLNHRPGHFIRRN